jgi:predicted nucleic-acid-binding protein
MRAVDTNALVRVLSRDDPKQAAAADQFISAGAWVSHLVLMEAIWVLSTAAGLDPNNLARAIQMVLDHRDLTLEDSDTVTSALAEFRRHPALGFADCLILEVARKAGHLPLGTFDRPLARLQGVHKL